MQFHILFILALLPRISAYLPVSQQRVPCTHESPVNGGFSTSRSETTSYEVHEFYCNHGYKMFGVSRATCMPTGFLDIRRIPVCVESKPRTAHVFMETSGVNCRDSSIADTMVELIVEYMTRAATVVSGVSKFKEIVPSCGQDDQLKVEVVFYVPSDEARNELDAWSRKLDSHEERQGRRRHKRFSEFEDADTDTTSTTDCGVGSGLSGDTCEQCAAGYYSNSNLCHECPIGEYQPTAGQTECLTCVNPKTTLDTASTQASDCVESCTPPSPVLSGAYYDSINNAITGSVTEGESITLVCDAGYTVGGSSSKVETCNGATSSQLPNECYDPSIAPTDSVYKFVDDTVTVTCTVVSASTPTFTLTTTDSRESFFTIVAVDGSVQTSGTTHTQRFSIGSVSGIKKTFRCEVSGLVSSGGTDTSNNLDVAFYQFVNDNTAAITQNSGTTNYEISVKLTDDSDASTTATFTWKKDSAVISTAQKRVVSNYIESYVTIASVDFDDAGTYSVSFILTSTVDVLFLAETTITTLSVRGFTAQPYYETEGTSTVTFQEGSQVTLTCAFTGVIESGEQLDWTIGGDSTAVGSGSPSQTEDSGVTTSKLAFSSWPSDFSSTADLHCSVLVRSPRQLMVQSSPISVTSTSYTISFDGDASACIEAGEDQTFTCEASLSNANVAPTITWYKVVDGGSDTQISVIGGSQFSTTEQTVSTKRKSVLTLTSATAGSAGDTGEYYCKALYADVSNTVIQTVDNFGLNVYELSGPGTKYAIVGAQNVQFTTSYEGPTPSGASWLTSTSNTLGSGYTLSQSVQPYSISVDTVSDIAYDMVLTVNIGSGFGACTGKTATYTADLQVLTSDITLSTGTAVSTDFIWVNEGDPVTVTCAFTSDTSTPTVTWTTSKTSDSTAIQTGSNDESAISSGRVQISFNSVTYADHAGTYQCSVNHGANGIALSNTINLVVLGSKPPVNAYTVIDTNAQLTCSFTGRGGVVEWKQVSDSSRDFTSNTATGSFDASTGVIESVLTISGATEADSGQYRCTMTFTGVAQTKQIELRHTIIVTPTITVSGASDDISLNSVAVGGASVAMTCSYTYAAGLDKPTVTWTGTKASDSTSISIGANDETGATTTPTASVTVTLSSVTYADYAGTYKCTVAYDSNQSVDSELTTLHVVDKIEKFDSYTVIEQESILTCKFSGMDGSVAWTTSDGSAASGTTDTKQITPLTGEVMSTFTISTVSASDNGGYTCTMSYTGTAITQSLNPVLTVIEIAPVVVTGGLGADNNKVVAGDSFTVTCATTNTLPDQSVDMPWAWSLTGPNSVSVSETTDKSLTETITSTVEHNGVYTCALTFNSQTVPPKEATVYVRNKDSEFNIVASMTGSTADNFWTSDDSTKTRALLGDSGLSVTLTCEFYGDAVSTVQWKKDGTAQSGDGSDIVITGPTASGSYKYISTMVLNNIVDDTSSDGYTCTGTYTEAVGTPTVESNSLELEFVGVVSVTSSNPYADKDETTNYVCTSYDLVQGATGESSQVLISGGGATGTGKSVGVTLSSYSMNGEVTCTGTYTMKSPDITFTSSKSITQYVRGAEISSNAVQSASNYYVVKGQDLTATCTFHGDVLASPLTWSPAGTSNEVPYASFMTQSTVTYSSLQGSGSYQCSGTYTQGNVDDDVTLSITVLQPTVAPGEGSSDDITVGDDTTLVCNAGDMPGAYQWYFDGTEKSGEESSTLSISSASFADAGDYTCEVAYSGLLNNAKSESDALAVFVSGIVTLTQEKAVDNLYNDVGETITLVAAIKNKLQPSGFALQYNTDSGFVPVTLTNTPVATSVVTASDWSVTLEFAAIKPASGNSLTLQLSTTAPANTATVSIVVFATCTLPDRTGEGIPGLTGQTIGHLETVENLVCDGGKQIVGATKVECNDGTIVYSVPDSAVPECAGFDTEPDSQLVGVGDTVTLTCTTTSTDVAIASINWIQGTDTVVSTKTDFGVVSGAMQYSSTYEVTGAENGGTPVTYTCQVLGDNNGLDIKSRVASIFIVGVARRYASLTGTYFESDEEADIVFELYNGDGITSVTGVFTASGENAVPSSVTFAADPPVDGKTPYKYRVVDAAYKQSGSYTVTVVYDKAANTVGVDTISSILPVAVYQPCDPSSLAAVSGGVWSSDTVRHMGYATLTCSGDTFLQGDGRAECDSGTFDTPSPTPSCQSVTELSCGELPPIDNGDVVYTDSNTGSYVCNPGYSLFGAEASYTCDTETQSWSIITVGNPSGGAPLCQVAVEAVSRISTTDMDIEVTTDICTSSLISTTEEALKQALIEAGVVSCLTSLTCTWEEFTCVYDSASTPTKLDVSFKLTQTAVLADKTVITDDVSALNADGTDITFEVDDGSRKRATVTADVITVNADAPTTTCPLGSISLDGTCSTCPSGYGVVTDNNGDQTCAICDFNTYNIGNNIAACTACSGDDETLQKGSTVSSQCLDSSTVCVVKAAVNAYEAFVPPSGAKVLHDTYLKLSCDDGYAKAYGVASTLFQCSTATYLQCYATCSLAKYTDTYLNERFIHDSITKDFLLHDETITMACMTGYEVAEDAPVKTYTCSNGQLPDFSTCIKQSTSKVMTAVIVIVVVLGVAVILLFIFILIQWRKKKQTAYKVSGKKLGFVDPIENMAAEEGSGVPMNKVSLKLSEADKKAPLMSRPVHISDFSKYYDLLTRNDDKELKQEFSTFDAFDDNNTCYHGSIPENDSKNRYKNIIPFDHSRVKLSIIGDDVHSDYINASYIHGYHKPRVFVATQAPLYETLDDFWRMTWEKKSTIIVNLTRVEENGKMKSIVYWPSVEERTKKFGKVSVTRLDKQESDYFVVYTFQVKHADEEEAREVYMFNYVGWPDFDVPTRSNEFVEFIYNIRHVLFVRPPLGPLICHCSAGTGRTGAFIGIMNSLDRLIHKEDLDTLGLVGSLRQQRRKMVFTHMQYKFLHRVILDIVSNDELEVLRQNGFRKKLDVRGVVENPYVSTSESDELDELNDTKV